MRWIFKLKATSFPGLNDSISYKLFFDYIFFLFFFSGWRVVTTGGLWVNDYPTCAHRPFHLLMMGATVLPSWLARTRRCSVMMLLRMTRWWDVAALCGGAILLAVSSTGMGGLLCAVLWRVWGCILCMCWPRFKACSLLKGCLCLDSSVGGTIVWWGVRGDYRVLMLGLIVVH